MKPLIAAVVAAAALALAGCASGTPDGPSITVTITPGGLPNTSASAASGGWTIHGTTVTGTQFTSPQAVASALKCPVVSAPANNDTTGIPSNGKGVYCDATPSDPVLVAWFATPAAEDAAFIHYTFGDSCMLVGPGWFIWDTQPNGTPSCDHAQGIIGGTRADLGW